MQHPLALTLGKARNRNTRPPGNDCGDILGGYGAAAAAAPGVPFAARLFKRPPLGALPVAQLRGKLIVLRADGLAADRLLRGVIPLFELDSYATPVAMMAPVPGDALDPAVEAAYRAALDYNGPIERMERFAFYERAKKAYAVVLTGETGKYGNVILKKGVTPVA